jgi:phosphatidate cytidylyltransferase
VSDSSRPSPSTAAESVDSAASPPSPPRARNATRFVSAAVLLPLALIPTFIGREWFAGLVVGVAAAAAWELAGLQRRAGLRVWPLLAVLVAAASVLLGAIRVTDFIFLAIAAICAVGLLLLGPSGEDKSRLEGALLSLAAGAYPGVLLAPAIPLRDRPDGLGWVITIMAVTWVCDTAAFFVGRRWGRHKLAPSVSPGKTIEGLIGGLAGGLLVGGAAALVIFPTAVPRVLGLSLVVAIAAVVGDLVESGIKRKLGAKDSGWIVPGHGGLLDRIDGLLFAAFLGYFYVAMTDGVLRA